MPIWYSCLVGDLCLTWESEVERWRCPHFSDGTQSWDLWSIPKPRSQVFAEIPYSWPLPGTPQEARAPCPLRRNSWRKRNIAARRWAATWNARSWENFTNNWIVGDVLLFFLQGEVCNGIIEGIRWSGLFFLLRGDLCNGIIEGIRIDSLFDVFFWLGVVWINGMIPNKINKGG